MSIVSAIIDRLSAMDPPVFAIIGGAADFASVVDEIPNAVPAAYVLIEEEASEPNERATGPVLQRTEADVAVIIVTNNFVDTTGGAAAADIEEVKKSTRGRLVGFVVDAETGEVIEHIGANLLKAKGGYVWHRELFGAAHYIEEQS
jgi:hypothetical protein